MGLCPCAGITLVGKFTNRIVEIESSYPSNKQSCEMVKLFNSYKYEKTRLENDGATEEMLAPLLRFERETLEYIKEKYWISSCVCKL